MRSPAASGTVAGEATPPQKPHEPVDLTAKSIYLPQLDGLRAFAVLMLFFSNTADVPFLWAGVDLFFILSGFLITTSLLRRSEGTSFGPMLGHFYVRRAQRVLPAYVLCMSLIVLLMHENLHKLWPFYALPLQNIPYAFRWIGWSPLLPLWPLAVDLQFCLLWPFLVYFLPRHRLALCMLGLVLGVPLLRALCTPLFPFSEPIYVLLPFRIDAMAAGALAALLLPKCDPQKVRRWVLAAMCLGLVLYATLNPLPAFHRDANTAGFNGLAYSLNILILGGLLVLVLLSSPRHFLVRALASAPMRGLGRRSYAFYLLHVFVFMRFTPYLAPRVVLPGAFLMTLALAAFSWKYVERPILTLGHNRAKNLEQPAA